MTLAAVLGFFKKWWTKELEPVESLASIMQKVEVARLEQGTRYLVIYDARAVPEPTMQRLGSAFIRNGLVPPIVIRAHSIDGVRVLKLEKS